MVIALWYKVRKHWRKVNPTIIAFAESHRIAPDGEKLMPTGCSDKIEAV